MTASTDREVSWVGIIPSHCQLCMDKLTKDFWDARMRHGRWAIVCGDCHKDENMGVGTGHGQRYELQKDGRWMKVEG